MTDKNNEKISIADAYHLKHELNKQIQYKGLNAREVTDLQEISKEEWTVIVQGYKKWVKSMRVIPNIALVIIAVISGGLAWYVSSEFLRWVFIIVAFYTAKSLFQRIGHAEGYMDGCRDGMERGIEKALGINEEEAKDVYDRSVEMEMDEGVVNRLNKK